MTNLQVALVILRRLSLAKEIKKWIKTKYRQAQQSIGKCYSDI